MVKINTLPLGPLQTNCYIVHEENASSCVVVDPAYSSEAILDYAKRQGLTIEAILLTHGHFDHVGAVEELLKETGCALYLHNGDYHMRRDPMNNYLYPLHDRELAGIRFCEDGTEISAAGLSFTVLHTPGHSRGSVCYRVENVLLSGDTLFAGGCGRTDLPGHGESTTLAQEKRYNPYMR